MPSTWTPIDLGPVLAGETTEPPPAWLARDDGARLLYAGKLHAVQGEPESCKGWFALYACAEALEAGEHVTYVDFEDSAAGVVGRLRDLGVDEAAIRARFRYVRPDDPLDDEAWAALAQALEPCPALVVLDGVTDAMTLNGLSLEGNADVATWLRMLPKRIAALGAAVVLVDHVVKDKDGRGRYAIGAQHKLAGTYAAYSLEVVHPFGRGREGLVKVRVQKDRGGYVREHEHGGKVAEMRLASGAGGAVSIDLRAPEATGLPDDPETFRPTALMERLSRAIEDSPGMSKRDVRAVRGNSDYLDKALTCLLNEGYVETRGEGRANEHHSLRAFRGEADEADRAHRAHAVPERARGTVCAHVPTVPPPYGARGTGHGQSSTVQHGDRAQVERLATPEEEAELLRLSDNLPDPMQPLVGRSLEGPAR